MAKKIFLIPIEGEEQIAEQFIELICLAKGFYPSKAEFTEAELKQEKLDFVGLIAGKALRLIAEDQLKAIKIQEAITAINNEVSGAGDALTVKTVTVQDGND